MKSAGHPTLYDVALRAGVSPKTASRVLNGEPNVRPEKIERVRAAAQEIGFRRNEMARLLRTQTSTSMVGVITGPISDPFWAALVGGLESHLVGDRFVLSAAIAERSEREAEVAMAMVERRVMALTICPVASDQTYLEPAIRAGLPIVAVDRPAQGIDIDTVLADDRVGARRGTTLLIESGHREIAFIARGSRYTTGERLRGFRRSMSDHRLDVDEQKIFTGANTDELVHEALDELRHMPNPPTAIFYASIAITTAAISSTRALGWTPGYVGFSEFPTSAALAPAATIIDNDAKLLGQQAAEMIERRIGGDRSGPERVRIASNLVVRESHLQFP